MLEPQRDHRKLFVLSFGVVALAGVLTLAAAVAPSRSAQRPLAFVPDASAVILRVRTPDRAALAPQVDNVERAVADARDEIERARRDADPRYLGRAQARLAAWWSMATPPLDVLLLRATIEQSLHDFASARRDLDQLVSRRPADAQAHVTRAVVAIVSGDYAAARTSCLALRSGSEPLVATTCTAQLDSLTRDPAAAYETLTTALAAGGGESAVRTWAKTTLAEIAIQRGDLNAARSHFESVLQATPDDTYALGALADVLIDSGDAQGASALLAGRESIDSLLLRRAIAERAARGPEADALAREVEQRFRAAHERGDRIHLREEARFALDIEGRPGKAVRLALDNWGVQREFADARLLARAAAASRSPVAAIPVVLWRAANGVRDRELDRTLATWRLR